MYTNNLLSVVYIAAYKSSVALNQQYTFSTAMQWKEINK